MFIIFILSGFLYCQDKIQRPEPTKVLKSIESLNLTQQQIEKITKDLNKNLKAFDSLNKKYEKKLKEKNELEMELEEIKTRLIEYNKNVTHIIKTYLDEQQLIKLDEIIKKQKERNVINQEKVKDKPKETDKSDKETIKDEGEKFSPFSIYFP